MSLTLTKTETEEALHSLKRYFTAELDGAITDLQASLLLDFILKEIGPFAYNQGVKHAEEFLRGRLEDLGATCYETPLTYWTRKKK